MNTYLGCDTESLGAHAERTRERADQIAYLLGAVEDTARQVPWRGPDAEDFLLQVLAVLSLAKRWSTDMAGRAAEMIAHRDEQDEASAADHGQGAELSNPPITHGGLRAPLRPDDAGESALFHGGLRHRPHDPGNPLPGGAVPVLPGAAKTETAGATWDPETLAKASEVRRELVSGVPIAGTFQYALDTHTSVGDGIDDAEGWLARNDLQHVQPALATLRATHAIGGIALGEESNLGRAAEGIDRSIANVMQTSEAIGVAALEGDGLGVARELEYGLERGIESSSYLVGGPPVIPVIEAGETVAGGTADIAEPFAPQSFTDRMRGVEESLGEFRAEFAGSRDAVTQPPVFDLRRRYAPMPWDDQG